MKKTICLVLAIVMCLGVFMSCGATENEGAGQSSISSKPDKNKTDKSEEKTDEDEGDKGGGNKGNAENGDKNIYLDREKYKFDLSQYMSIPDYKSKVYDIEEDDIKQAISVYLMQFSSEYTVKRGDKIQVDIRFYSCAKASNGEFIDFKGEEITELFQEGVWIENIAAPSTEGDYQISSQIENGVLGSKIGATVSNVYTIDKTFFDEKYHDKRIFVDVTVKNRECEPGDVLTASYTGYHIDSEGNIIKENGQEKIFDSSDNSPFYIGSHLAIDDIENGLIGMTIGEEKDIYATFPTDYEPDKTLAGKRVLFKIRVKAVFTPPAYNDDFVKKYFSSMQTTKKFEEALIKECILNKVYSYIEDNTQVTAYPTAEYNTTKEQLEAIADAWHQNGSTLEQYIKSEYDMTVDQYIKANMKTEMIFYRLSDLIGADAVPTEAELVAKKESLIQSTKNDYMSSQGYSESQAYMEACEYMNKLGESYVYEQVMYEKIDEIIPTQAKINYIESAKEYVWEK